MKVGNFVDAKGKVQDSLKIALKDGSFALSPEIKQTLIVKHGDEQAGVIEANIQALLRKLAGRLDVKTPMIARLSEPAKPCFNQTSSKALWDRIKYKTTYRVEFDNLKLIKDCAEAIRNCPPITKTRAQFRKADIAIGKGGVTAEQTSASGYTTIHENDIELPDIITDLRDKTQLTRKASFRYLSIATDLKTSNAIRNSLSITHPKR